MGQLQREGEETIGTKNNYEAFKVEAIYLIADEMSINIELHFLPLQRALFMMKQGSGKTLAH